MDQEPGDKWKESAINNISKSLSDLKENTEVQRGFE